MSVHYKFKSALEYDTVTFDGLHISVKDLKKAILQQKRIGKHTDFDLQVTNAQTKEVYTDENALIPKNTSLIIARVPILTQTKTKQPWETYGSQSTASSIATKSDEIVLSKTTDLTQLDASEDDKILAMITQSTLDYDPSNYVKIRGSNQVGVVPTHYRCFKCHQPGHWIKDCPLGHGQEPVEIKKSTGIPRSFMVPVEGPMVPGAMMTPTGQYAVPVLDHQAYNEPLKPANPVKEEKPEIPEDLLCNICKDLLTDAVMMPCCGNSFCDECIRTVLLESEDHECPDCHEKDNSPSTLIPNRFLRNSVLNFKYETGYRKKQRYRNAVKSPVQTKETTETIENSTVHPTEIAKEVSVPKATADLEQTAEVDKPIISEADSTESSKATLTTKEELSKVTLEKSSKVATKESYPGEESKEKSASSSSSIIDKASKGQAITSVGGSVNSHKVLASQSESKQKNIQTNSENSQIRSYSQTNTASYVENSRSNEERSGTPTVDEPGVGSSGYPSSDVSAPGVNATTTTLPPSQQMQSSPIQSVGTYPMPPGLNSATPYTPNPSTTFIMPPPGHPDYNSRVNTGTGTSYGGSLARMLLVTSLDPSVPPPNVPPSQGHTQRPVFDPSRPPYDIHRHAGNSSSGYHNYPPGHRGSRNYPPPRYMQPPPPGMHHRSSFNSTTIIDDPLEAFNRMLREKDERDRRARQRRRTRSRTYSCSRSSSRSYTRSPRSWSRSPVARHRRRSRSRTPPPRTRRSSRSRSRSFSMSRSRSYSRSPTFRGSPNRDYSPRRRPPSRYRSPYNRNSPSRYRYKDVRSGSERERERNVDRERDRDRDRERDRDRDRERDRMHNDRKDRDYHFFDNAHPAPMDTYDYDPVAGYDRGRNSRPPLLRNPRYGTQPPPYPRTEPYYPPPQDINNYQPHNNRYPSRGPHYPPPLMSVKTAVPPHACDRLEGLAKKYDDVAPPGIDQPPVPGFENQRYDPRYHGLDKVRDEGPPGVDKYPNEREEFKDVGRSSSRAESIRDARENRNERKLSPASDRRSKRSVSRSSRDRVATPDKFRKQRIDESYERDKRSEKNEYDRDKKEKKKDGSDDEKVRSKDKKKKRDRDRTERRKKKDKKEKKEQEKSRKAEDKKLKEKDYKDDKVEDKLEVMDKEVKKDKNERNKENLIREYKKVDEKKDKSDKKSEFEMTNEKEEKAIEKMNVENQELKEKKEVKQDKLQIHEIEAKQFNEQVGSKDKEDADITAQRNEAHKLRKIFISENEKKDVQTQIEEKSKSLEHKGATKEKKFQDITEQKLELNGNQKTKMELYDDVSFEVDNNVVENYGRIDDKIEKIASKDNKISDKAEDKVVGKDEGECDKDITYDGLELQVNEDFMDSFKSKSCDVLPVMPEPSKWEIDDDLLQSPEKFASDSKLEMKQSSFDRSGKVTSEVLKRAENAIFAKAINAIRPIEIKKIVGDRARLYSGEKNSPTETKDSVKNLQVVISTNKNEDPSIVDAELAKVKSDRGPRNSPCPNRLSVKERLGCKVEELDRLTREDISYDRHRSKSLSPFSRRIEESNRNDKRLELEDKKRGEFKRHSDRHRIEYRRHYRHERSRSRDGRSSYYHKRGFDRRDHRRDRRERRSKSYTKHQSLKKVDHKEDKQEPRERGRRMSKSKRSKSRSESKDKKDKRKKNKDKRQRKEKDKTKKVKKEDMENDVQDKKQQSKSVKEIIDEPEPELKPVEKSSTPRAVANPSLHLDEDAFEPNYDLESEYEKEEIQRNQPEPQKKRERSKSSDKTGEEFLKKQKIEEAIKKPQSSCTDTSDDTSDGKYSKRYKKHKKKKSKRDISSTSSSSDSETSVEKRSKKRLKSRKKLKKRKKAKHR